MTIRLDDTIVPGNDKLASAEGVAYDDLLRENGSVVAGETSHSAHTDKTLRSKAAKVLVTDGPFAETREQLGGRLVLEARDMVTHAPGKERSDGRARRTTR